jgi:hypothetical protein
MEVQVNCSSEKTVDCWHLLILSQRGGGDGRQPAH